MSRADAKQIRTVPEVSIDEITPNANPDLNLYKV